jgi:hypothetical protein
MYDVRRRLMAGDRSHSPCSKCSVHGTLSGEPSFRLLLAHYLRTGEIGPDELPPDLSDLATGEKDRPA